MSRIWYTSDLHFSHKRVAEDRGFGEDTEAHDAIICENWIKNVRAKDQIYVLGDISIGGHKNEHHALDLISKLPGMKKIIFGNHDSPSPIHSKPEKYFKDYMDVFEFGAGYVCKKINGQTVELSHYPFSRDHTDNPRYVNHRRPDYGQWLIHGHIHDHNLRKDGRQIHIGLDSWEHSPVSQEQVVEYMEDPYDFAMFVDGIEYRSI